MTTPLAQFDVDERRAWRGLWWLTAANIACQVVVVAVNFLWDALDPLNLGWARYVFRAAAMTTIDGQALAFAIAAAFTACRRFAGLLATIAFSIVLGAIAGFPYAMRDVAARDVESVLEWIPYLWFHCTSLFVFAIAQGLRFLLGWRLVLPSAASQVPKAQFRIADMIEWTLSVGMFLGLSQLSGWFGDRTPELLALLAVMLIGQALVSLPVALSVVARGRWRRMFFLAMGIVLVAMAGDHVASGYWFGGPPSTARQWVSILVRAASYVAVVGINFAAIRRLGFQLTSPTKRAATNQPC
jgi:hypothetical protein